MRTIRCADCGCQRPMGEAFALSGTTLCSPCVEARFKAAGGKLQDLHRMVDPTVCVRCGTDYGDRPLPLVMELPVCNACNQKMQNPSFPGWVKLTTAGVLVLAAISMVRNWRFFQGYVENRRGQREAAAGRYDQARDLLASASRHVPESATLADGARLYTAYALANKGDFDQAQAILSVLAKEYPDHAGLQKNVREMSARRYEKQAFDAYESGNLHQAIALMDQAIREMPDPVFQIWRDSFQVFDLLDQDRNEEALAMARRLVQENPEFKEELETIVLRAEIALAFHREDYDTFLDKAKALQAAHPDNPSFVAQVASALACKYVVTGQEDYKTQALSLLEQARKLPEADDQKFKDYQERILHRLRTREIITEKEYDRRFRAATQPTSQAAKTQEGDS